MRFAFPTAAAACLLAAAPAWGQPADERIKEIKAYCISARERPQLTDLIGVKSPGEQKSFAAGLAGATRSHRVLCDDLEAMLKGGRHDPDGRHIRAIMRYLPASEWWFVGEIERERKLILEELGPGSGFSNSCQTLTETFGSEKALEQRCYERASLHKERIRKQAMFGRKLNWDSVDLTAKQGTNREHTVVCYVHDGKWEVVVDAWDGSMLPAAVWWAKWDARTGERIGHSSPHKLCMSPDEVAKLAK